MSIKVMFTLRYLCIVAFACALTGCGFVKTFYNNAPEIMAWWLDDYFDFTADQKAMLKPALTRIHTWHRQHQLPEEIATLKSLKLAVSNDRISPTEVCVQIDQFKIRLNTLQAAFIPVISEIAPSLSDAQLSYLKQKLNQRAEKWKSEWWQETPAEQIDARLEKTVEFAEKVYGNVSAAQRDLIKQKLLANPTKPALVYSEIRRRNQDIIQLIIALRNHELHPAQKQALIEAGFARLQASPNAEYQSHANLLTQRTCETIAELHTSTSRLQKEHASAWIGDITNQLSTPEH